MRTSLACVLAAAGFLAGLLLPAVTATTEPRRPDIDTINARVYNLVDAKGTVIGTITSEDGGPVMYAVGRDGTLRVVELEFRDRPKK